MHVQAGEMKFYRLHLARFFVATRKEERNFPYMPINKRESLLFTFIMCFCMVLWMSIYNVALQHGAVSGEVIADAWLGFPIAYVFAMCCDWFVASPLAKGFAFKHLVTPGKSSPRAMTLAVSSCMVVPMVIIMSLYGACEGLFHMPGGPLANMTMLPMMWLVNIPRNLIMALPWNLLVAGPLARFVFRRAFPMGTVFAEPHMELVSFPGAAADDGSCDEAAAPVAAIEA